jgi:nucleoside-diphosphate kinase
MKMERTLIFLKPDAVQRGLIGEITSRFEKRGFQIVGLKMLQLSEEFVREHYAAHADQEFYEPLIQYVIGSPIVAMVLEGKNAVRVVREMMGKTFGGESAPGTIRGDYALSDRYNLIHGSDGVKAAAEEIERFFEPEELFEHPPESRRWTYDMTGERPV